MSVFIDEQGHLITDGDLTELHAFAKSIGMKPGWFQNKHCKQPHPHYDVFSSGLRRKAIEAGAVEISSRDTVRILRKAAGKDLKNVVSQKALDAIAELLDEPEAPESITGLICCQIEPDGMEESEGTKCQR